MVRGKEATGARFTPHSQHPNISRQVLIKDLA